MKLVNILQRFISPAQFSNIAKVSRSYRKSEYIYLYIVILFIAYVGGSLSGVFVNLPLSRSLFIEGIKSNNLAFVKKILQNGQSIDVIVQPHTNLRPLSFCALFDYTDMAELFIERGANINEVNKEGTTPLIHAAWAGNTEMVLILLENGADTTIRRNDDRTAFWFATVEKHDDIVEVLKKHEQSDH